MQIYFTASLHGKEKLTNNYQKIINTIKKFGYKVIAEHIIKISLKDLTNQTDEDRINYYKRMIKSITKCDLVVAELSYSSASVGHEISIALEKGKPVVGLYFKGRGPHLLTGLTEEKLQIVDYDLDNLEKILKDTLTEAQEQMDVRFNFFISPKIGAYLDWVAKHKKIPRAVFLRRLIEEHMKKNKDYKA